VLGKHSGRHAFRDRVSELGFELDEFETNRAFQEFKKLADQKKDVYDGDIEAIIMNVDNASTGPWSLKSLSVQTSTDSPAVTTVELAGEDGEEASASAEGDGPIAAAVQALEQVTGIVITLRNFELHSASIGEDAQGEVTVTVEHDGHDYRGRGANVDIVEAGTRACLEVINRILRRRQRDDIGSRCRRRNSRHTGHTLYRPAPDPRGHYTAGVCSARGKAPAGPAARSDAGDHGPFDANDACLELQGTHRRRR
jgi:2-isopropylmalate synthase